MNDLPYKGRAIIVTDSEYNVQRIKDIIKGMSEFEWNYFPDDLVCTNFLDFAYVGKFSLDVKEFEIICADKGIPVTIREEIWEDIWEDIYE